MTLFPTLHASSAPVARAYRLALGDLLGNVQPFQDGLLPTPAPVLLAGLDYDTPWTRDAAINVWNGLGMFLPQVAANTLLSVLKAPAGQVRIGGQYWDAIIWAVGAWAYYLQTGDRDFLALALRAVTHSLARFEAEEFDPSWGLFRGPAVYGDGVAAYPDRYSPGGTSSILDWVPANPQRKAPVGYGLPMLALSTNCVYAQAYRVAGWMAAELNLPPEPAWHANHAALVAALRQHFWNPSTGCFDYLRDAEGGCDYQEGLGHALVLLFEIATPEQAASVLAHQHLTPAGIPCVYPTFPRYAARGGFGRHSGTIWPFINAVWGEAALQLGQPAHFDREFAFLTARINRDAQCTEIYHPLTGAIYGGLQEHGHGEDGWQWDSCARQSWSASAYLRMILNGLFGLRLTPAGMQFQPYLPAGIERLHLDGLLYRAAQLSISVEGQGRALVDFRLNGQPAQPFLPADATGAQHIAMRLRP